jgi:flagellar biosynthesis protein FlhA
VRIRDNMTLDPNAYRFNIRGAQVAESHSYPGMLLAMDSGIATGPIAGEPTKEPAFGLDAWWIEAGMKDQAESLNYTVVDPSSVIATHLSELVKINAQELLSREEVNNLIEALKEKSPRLVEEVIPGIIKAGELQRVMQNLLKERVPVRDLETIVETLGDWATRTKDIDVLTEYVRNGLRRAICQQYTVSPIEQGDAHKIVCVTLDPTFEDQVNAYIDRSQGGTTLAMPAHVAAQLARRIADSLEPVVASGNQPVVIASPQVRATVRQILVSGVEVESMGLVTIESENAAPVSAA